MEEITNEEKLKEVSESLDPDIKKKRLKVTIICVLLVVILAIASALLVKHYVITTFIVDGISMYPTLDGGNGAISEGSSQEERTNGEVLYLNKVTKKIKRGDIVVFAPEWPGLLDSSGKYKSLVKRVIALEGDHLQIIGNKVYLNGDLLNEDYINEEMTGIYNIDIVISEGCMFCMGDNRNHSSDCREYGEVSLSTIVGKCFMIKGINGKLRLVK